MIFYKEDMKSTAATCLLAVRPPLYRQHGPYTGVEREHRRSADQEKSNTFLSAQVGPGDSSEEASVMEVERRARVI